MSIDAKEIIAVITNEIAEGLALARSRGVDCGDAVDVRIGAMDVPPFGFGCCTGFVIERVKAKEGPADA